MIPETYARVLFDTTADRPNKEVEERLRRFLELLVQRGHLRALPRILRAFERLVFSHERRQTAKLTLASDSDAAFLREEIALAFAEFGIKDEFVRKEVDDKIIGGLRLQTKERLFDTSFKRLLLEAYDLFRRSLLRSRE